MNVMGVIKSVKNSFREHNFNHPTQIDRLLTTRRINTPGKKSVAYRRPEWRTTSAATPQCNAQAIYPVSFLQAGKAPDLPVKICLINEPDKTGVPDIKLIRTDTTLDLSQ
ncbi:hypothetical protein RF11_02367 [Thelohanellus kitauei]|uniref:Uncharacterized protein n=1 Tax=Thelohanellus kitauei TaxID=669202 RepID=A0A0C2M481_THEKT|nr:hypothetical protein RF11_02367 [Thelohanellus kitauei]